MRTRAIAGILVLAVLTPSCLGGGSKGGGSKSFPPPIPKWQTVQRTPTNSDLRAVLFANFAVGIVAGKDGSIFHTADGGVTWLQEEFTPRDRTGDIAALAAQNLRVTAVGSDAMGAREWFTDNSFTWTTPDVDASGSPYVDVALDTGGAGPNDPVDTYRLRSNGTVDFTLRDGTSNSGGTGITVAKGFANVFKHLLPPSIPPFTFVVGDDGAGVGQIFKTPVGACPVPAAKTYRRATLAPTGQPFACGDDNSNNGIVVYISNPDATVASPTWDVLPGTHPALPSLQALSFPDVNVGYVVGNTGTIVRLSFDGVNWTWTPMNSGTAVNLYAVYFIDKDHGFAVGDQGTVLRTDNGTAASPVWFKMSSGDAGINWNAVSFSDDGVRGVAVGNAAAGGAPMVYRTINSGATWTSMDLSSTGLTTETLNGVSVPRQVANGTTAWFCGNTGVLFRNTDVWGTGSWSAPVYTGISTAHTYRGVLFPKTGDKGVLIGNNGGAPLLLTTNDGIAWAAPGGGFTAPTVAYYGLSSNPAGTAVYASGGNGKINTSTDLAGGWATWSDLTPAAPVAATLSSIQSPEGVFFRAMVAADDGKVYRLSTTPAWTPLATTEWGAEKPTRLAIQLELDGLALTDANRIYYTFDGGLNWYRSLPLTKAVPRALWMSPTVPGLGYAACDDGVILRTQSVGH